VSRGIATSKHPPACVLFHVYISFNGILRFSVFGLRLSFDLRFFTVSALGIFFTVSACCNIFHRFGLLLGFSPFRPPVKFFTGSAGCEVFHRFGPL
jgi:hypothetical protein